MTQVTIHEAKVHLSKLIQRSLAGEEIIIVEDGKPLVRLEAITGSRTERRLGAAKGVVKYMSDDFDAPLPDIG